MDVEKSKRKIPRDPFEAYTLAIYGYIIEVIKPRRRKK
jgi:hypothetical protein